jgi:hypothetical protein
MPVLKYRSIEEMDRASRPLPKGDPAIVRKMRYLWRLSSAFGPLCIPRGVRKYRSIEEANADRDVWEQKRVTLWRDMRRAQRKP